jgi:hypothetical protein
MSEEQEALRRERDIPADDLEAMQREFLRSNKKPSAKVVRAKRGERLGSGLAGSSPDVSIHPRKKKAPAAAAAAVPGAETGSGVNVRALHRERLDEDLDTLQAKFMQSKGATSAAKLVDAPAPRINKDVVKLREPIVAGLKPKERGKPTPKLSKFKQARLDKARAAAEPATATIEEEEEVPA